MAAIPVIAGVFAAALDTARPQLNYRIDLARRTSPAFDGDRFAAFLVTAVESVVQAVAARAPERVPAVVVAAVDAALALRVAEPALAVRSARIQSAWMTLAGPCAVLIAAHPEQVLAMLGNAILHIERSGARAAQWCAEMAALASRAGQIAQLAALGQLLAWRAGMAHFRPGALAAGDVLPEALACAALRLPAGTSWTAAAAALRADPWWGPDGDRSSGIEAGAFIGLGGAFMAPPKVRPCADGFLVDGGARVHLLVADRHGAVLHAADRAEFDAAPATGDHPAVRLHRSELTLGEHTMELDLPPDDLRAVCNLHTVALFSPYTHAIRLVPLP